MRRFIRYLYEYGQGKKVRNVGFVNVEQDAAESTIHIHGKGFRLAGGDALGLYLFWEKDGRNIGVYQGDVAFMGPAVNYRLKYTPEDTDGAENYNAVGGIILKDRNGRTFAAVWEDETADVEKIPCGTLQEVSGAEKPVVTNPVREEAQPEPSEAQPERVTDEEETERMDDASQPERMPGGAEAEEMNSVTQPVKTDESAEAEGSLFRTDREEEPADQDETAEMSVQEECENTFSWNVTKIQRNEISRLPRCEWRLANNNFLLHGYHNYHHLVLLDDGKVLRLGVPGIYHMKEARAAAGFGFPEFIGADEIKLTLNDEECSDEDDFGYWCRQVRYPVRQMVPGKDDV